MGKYSRVISVSGRKFFASETMGDIFMAHADDIRGRHETALVPLVHEGGVEMLLIGPMSRITVSHAPMPTVPSITGPIAGLPVTTAA